MTTEMRASVHHASPGRINLHYEAAVWQAQVYVQSSDVRLEANHEAAVSSALLPCMASGADLVASGPVSARLLGSLELIQTVYRQWYPYLQRVQVRGAEAVRREANPAGRVGILFSAGIDSFYTLLKRPEGVTDLIYIRGFEFPVEEREFLDRMAVPVRATAERLGLRVIEVETDLRPFLLSQGLRWGLHAGGATKITLGHLLFPELKRLYISAGCTYAELFPWGSHVVLDPLWNTEGMEFIFFGMEANRNEKLQLLAQHGWPLQWLHVCNEPTTTALNCGRCEKCIRTMLGLLTIGALDRCPTFETELDPRNVERLRLHNEGMRAYARRNLLALERGGHSPALILALRKAIRRARRNAAIRELLQSTLPTTFEGLRRLRGRWRRPAQPTDSTERAGIE